MIMSRRGKRWTKPRAIGVVLPLEFWPEGDQALWRKAMRDGDALEPGGLALKWAPSTRGKCVKDWGHWLAWMSRADRAALQLDPLVRLTRDRVRAYIDDMEEKGLSQSSVATFVRGLGSMAWVMSEGSEHTWIFRAGRRMGNRAVPVRNKRQRMQTTYRLAELGLRLMHEARQEPTAMPAALKFRNGLMIALLAYCPIRRGNLASIRIGEHLRKCEDGFELAFGKHETKQKRILHFGVPAALTAGIETYIEFYRPILMADGPFAGTAGDAFWVSADSGPLLQWGVYVAITKATRRAFGKSLNPHLFRDCAATTIAVDDPVHARIIREILGHATMVTSERHYNQAQAIHASRRYQTVVDTVRRQRLGLARRPSAICTQPRQKGVAQ